MYKTSSQIADEVLAKIARHPLAYAGDYDGRGRSAYDEPPSELMNAWTQHEKDYRAHAADPTTTDETAPTPEMYGINRVNSPNYQVTD